jgi:ADP-heptose:LPS heptosyltransferase
MRIVVFQIWGLGDLLMTVPVITEIRRRYPSAELAVVVRGKAQGDLLRGSSLDLEILTMPPRSARRDLLAFFITIRRRRFDVAYVATRTSVLLAAVVRVFCGIETVIGDGSRRTPFYTHRGSIDSSSHRVMRMLDTLAVWTGGSPGPVTFALPVSPSGEREAGRVLSEARLKPGAFVAVHPGSGRTKGYLEKRLPPALVRGMLGKIRRDFPDLGIAVVIGPDDTDIIDGLEPLPEGVSLVSDVSLEGMKALLKKCVLFVGSDSALGHISAAFAVPTVTVTGPTDPAESRPLGPQSAVVTRSTPLPCQPCWHTRLQGRCPYNAQCMRDISIAEAYRVIRGYLDDRGWLAAHERRSEC